MSLADLSHTVSRDFVRAFCGDMLGEGMSREVYALATDPTKIIKIEERGGMFQNVIEWETWSALKDTPHAKWLAPCHFISPTGTVLVMQRTTALRIGEEPAEMPPWLTDFKRTNYGLIDGRVVCHDYGTNLLLNQGAFTKRMRKAEWC